MKIEVKMLDGGIKKIDLSGRMDIEGTQQIDMRLTMEVAVEKGHVVVDLSGVDFMSSIGIGALVRTAKALKLRHGKLVLLNPQPVVELVLKSTQIHTIIPICKSIEEARKTLMETPSHL